MSFDFNNARLSFWFKHFDDFWRFLKQYVQIQV